MNNLIQNIPATKPTTTSLLREVMGRNVRRHAEALRALVRDFKADCGAIEIDSNTFGKYLERATYWTAYADLEKTAEALLTLADRLECEGGEVH